MSMVRLFGKAVWLLLREWQRMARQQWPVLLLFFGFTLAVALWLHRWDPRLEEWVRTHQNEDHATVARLLSDYGRLHMAPFCALILLAVAGFWRHTVLLRWAALSGLLAGCVAGVAANIGKIIVGRPRPSTLMADLPHWFQAGYDYASFPSGHASHCMAVASAVVVLAPRSGVLMILASFAVCWSRWYLIRHYISDVWAGSCLGLAVGLLFGLSVRRILSGKSEYGKVDLSEVRKE